MKARVGLLCFGFACLTAGLIPLAAPDAMGVKQAEAFPGWPSEFEGRPIWETELTLTEAAFNRVFPGRMARFTDGKRVLVFRWVTAPSHRVHSGADCLQSSSFTLTPGELWRDEAGRVWSVWEAEGPKGRMRVRERCYDAMGNSWPDVSAWFWTATLGSSEGPWWVVTVAEGARCLN